MKTIITFLTALFLIIGTAVHADHKPSFDKHRKHIMTEKKKSKKHKKNRKKGYAKQNKRTPHSECPGVG